MNGARALAHWASETPDVVAIQIGDRAFTYRELDDQSAAVAGALRAVGVKPGDRVALWLGNEPSFARWLYGAWRAGATVVPLHAALTAREASHILHDSGAKTLVCHDALGIKVDATFNSEESFSGGSKEIVEGDIALVAYTSGTAGAPKGAVLTHKNLSANIGQMKTLPIGLYPGDIVLSVLPLFHIYGLNVALNFSIACGTKLVVTERFDAIESADAIAQYGVTVIVAAPPAYVAWLRAELDPAVFATVRSAACGAAPLPAEVLTGFKDRFGVTIWEGYGMTETSPTLTSTSVAGVVKPRSIGRPLPGVELMLAGEDGEPAEPGDPGEILVKGPNVFAGYWNHPEIGFTNGWFKTGDIAVQDDDGDLFIVDRDTDLILVSGFNVYPQEVEDVVSAHDAVIEAGVVGIPDDYHGEAVKAVVVTNRPLSEQALLDHCRLNLAPYKVPSSIEFRNELPKNAAGKVLRRALRS